MAKRTDATATNPFTAKQMSNKTHRCKECHEAFYSLGMLRAHEIYVHENKSKGWKKQDTEEIRQALMKEHNIIKDELDFADQIGSGDLDEARELLKGGDA